MSEVATSNGSNTPSKVGVKEFINNPEIQKRIKNMLNDRASGFTTSVLSLVSADPSLAECVPATVFSACLTAASLDLPINKNLGFAHIIAYKNNKKGISEAQFQMGWKGFIQLAQRSGQYKTISATEVYEGQLVDSDPLRGNTYDWKQKTSDTVVGYVAFFKLTNGFEKELYMSVEELKKHGKQYSQSYKHNFGPWVDNFNAMALKTVIKLLISKFGPQSVDIQKALVTDQSVSDGKNTEYVDNDLLDVNATEDEQEAILNAQAQEAQVVGSTKPAEDIEEGEQASLVDVEPEQPDKPKFDAEAARKRYSKK